MGKKSALLTGVTGQDGAYLAKLLLEKGYTVYATHRRTSSGSFWRLESLDLLEHGDLNLIEYDLTDPGAAYRLLSRIGPDEIYNLAAQSFVGVSFEKPTTTSEITGLGCLYLLEAIRDVKPDTRFYQASTSEMFGKVQSIPQNEDTPFYPRSPYGVAKLYAHWMTVNYREAYGLYATSGILFNHESPLRGLEFVTRKITDGIARICAGSLDCIRLGNLDPKRDWGYAAEYVEGMWRMLQAEEPGSYVLATGTTSTVRDFVSMAARAAGIEMEWRGTGAEEIGIDTGSGKTIVVVDPKFYRPAEVDLLIGDPTRARKDLGWSPETELPELCSMMVRADLERHGAAPLDR